MVVIWQAAIPPLICAIALLIKYIAFTNAHPVRSCSPLAREPPYFAAHLTDRCFLQGKPQMWYATIQAMLGKVYILSLFFTLYVPTPFWRPGLRYSNSCVTDCLGDRNNRMDLTNEPPVTYVSTVNASLDGVGSPAQRYVFSVHCQPLEQAC